MTRATGGSVTVRRRLSHACLVLLASVAAARAAAAGGPEPVRIDVAQMRFFTNYCIECHGGKTQEGGVRLDDIPSTIADVSSADRWQKVLDVLNSGEMPPQDGRQPHAEELERLLEHLSGRMVAARKALSDSGGVIAMRRLNRREYENTIRDLVGVDIDAEDLPSDGGGGTFDTQGKSLFLSADQLEQYLALGRRALDAAIVTGPKPVASAVRVEPEQRANNQVEAMVKRVQRQAPGGADGRTYVDEKDRNFFKRQVETKLPLAEQYLARPETKTGVVLTLDDPMNRLELPVPADAPAGRYRLRIKAGRLPDAPPGRSYMEIAYVVGDRAAGRSTIACRQVTGTVEAPGVIEVEFVMPAGDGSGDLKTRKAALNARTILLRERQHNTTTLYGAASRQALAATGRGLPAFLWIDWVEWEGPLVEQWPPASHVGIFFKGEKESETDAYAREIVARFAARAFRGAPVRESFLERLHGHYQERRQAGESFVEAIKEPLSIVLASPSFLYMLEPAGSGPDGSSLAEPRSSTPLAGIELANRLAYFLWSGPPDDELIRVAQSGGLETPAVLAFQVDRLLASPKSWAFVTGFVHQWLTMERLDFFQFNNRLYPRFDANVKEAAREEVFATIKHVLDDDLPLGAVLKSDFVVVNDLLADYYGIDGVEGPEFRRVNVPTGMPRGGLLGMAAVLAMGSDGERSSPVERGAWVLRKLLDDPPPPAPANVPQLSRLAGKLRPARELLAAHMEQPQCATCHRKIDPIGFGLEHFDAAGAWRDKELTENVINKNRVRSSKEHDIDSRGTLPDGTSFDGFEGLRDAVARHDDAFARGLAENLIAYALARPFSVTDTELAAIMCHRTAGRGTTLRSMIQSLVASNAFHSK